MKYVLPWDLTQSHVLLDAESSPPEGIPCFALQPAKAIKRSEGAEKLGPNYFLCSRERRKILPQMNFRM